MSELIGTVMNEDSLNVDNAMPDRIRKPYSRPELLQYGALDEVTKLYNMSPCQGTCSAG
jgi:hypothetical protein